MKEKVKIICHPRCTTCKKAEKFLEDNGIEFDFRDIREENPTKDEIKNWHKSTGLPLKRFFNTSGQLYRSLELKDKLESMSEEEQYELLSTDGMLVKRPVLISDDKILIGFKQSEWEDLIK